MPRPPSKPPPDEPVTPVEKQPDAVPSVAVKLGLSKKQCDEAVKAMLRMVWKVGCPEHVQHLEVVHDAFVMAAAKPISKRPSIGEWKRFVAWLCTLAELAAKTSRKSKHRRLLGQGHSEDEVAALILAEGNAEALDARLDLHDAFTALTPADQELLTAIFVEGKTVSTIAREKGLARSTVDSRYLRALDWLRAALSSMIAAIVLLVTKKVRAQGARLAQHVSHLLPQAAQTACAMTVTVACGVMVPASSVAMVEHHEVTAAVPAASPIPTVAAVTVPKASPVAAEVAPVKPIAIDDAEKQWSASDMKSPKIASYLQATMLPFAFLVTPAMTQVACAGTEHSRPAPQQPEERDDSPDPYDMMCEDTHRRGNDCPSKADWYKRIGLCPDGTTDCQ